MSLNIEFDSELCARCKGRGYCGRSCKILAKLKEFLPKTKEHFSGSSPPEVFVGVFGYPYVYTGILSPQEYGSTEEFSMPEIWFQNQASIEQILAYRGRLIYSRFKSRIKDARQSKKLQQVMQEISLSSKSVSTEFFLKKAPRFDMNIDKHIAIIGNPAPLIKARLEENPKVEKKVEYLTSDTDVKASNAIQELYKGNIQVSNIIKVLSAGMLGLGIRRKFVPSRWSVTAVDDTISKFMLEKIRYYQEISEISLFNSEYIGNHYEFLLLPGKFMFEVLEAKMTGSVWNPSGNLYVAQDYENFPGRKNYADNVTGAYYSNRLALCEYLEQKKRQACCLVMRECRPDYFAPCGVGILREVSRQAFKNKPESFPTIQEALKKAQSRLRLPISTFTSCSWLLKEYGKQTRLTSFFS